MRNEIVLDHQCGFRCYNSTTEQILCIRRLQKHEIVMDQQAYISNMCIQILRQPMIHLWEKYCITF